MKSITTIMIALGLWVFVASCGRPAAPTTQEQLCENLLELQAAIQPLMNVSPGTETREVRGRMINVDTAWRGLTIASLDLPRVRINEWQAEYNEFVRAVEQLPGNATVGVMSVEVVEGARELNRLAEAAFIDLGCRR